MAGERGHPVVGRLHVVDDVVDGARRIQVVARPGRPRIELRGLEVLELHRVGPRVSRRVDQLERLLEAAVVIAAGLRDDVGGLAVADPALTDPHLHHAAAPRAAISRATRPAPRPSISACPWRLIRARRFWSPARAASAEPTRTPRSSSPASPIQASVPASASEVRLSVWLSASRIARAGVPVAASS